MRNSLALLIFLLAAVASADEPEFVARTASGKEYVGPLARLDDDWALEVGSKARRKVPSGELVELRQKDVALPVLPAGEQLILANGDRLPFTSIRLDDEKIYVKHPDLGADEVAVPIASVLLIWRSAPDRVVVPEKLLRSLLSGKRKNDIVLLRNGDRIEGTLNKITDESAEVDVGKKSVKTKWSQVAAVAMSTELADKPKAPELSARLVLTATDRSPGGRLTIGSPTLLKGELRGKTAFGAIVRVPLDRVASLEMVGGKAAALSSLKPSKYEYRPYLDEQYGYGVDATVTGRDLRVGGASYERGVGTHAPCAISYELGGKYARFEALVGLDDVDGKRGRVKVRVLVDGKEVDIGQKGVLSHKGGPWRMNVPVAAAKTLTLEVLAADEGNVQAVVNWVEARLVE